MPVVASTLIKNNESFAGKILRLRGAITSGRKAAYLGLLLHAFRPVSLLIDSIIANLFLRCQVWPIEPMPSSLMIVSPPRAGSTLIYQVLTRVIPSVYYSNFHYLFPESASHFMSRFNLFGKTVNEYANYYGYSPELHDVNEGNALLNRILNRKEPQAIRGEFIRILGWMKASPDRPFLFKNVRHYGDIAALHEAIPELNFLRIHRNTEHIIRSELIGYRELGTFHPVPPELWNSQISDPIEFCVRQIQVIERTLDRQFELLPSSVKTEWEYEEFCKNPEPHIESLASENLHLNREQLRFDNLTVNLQPRSYPEEDFVAIREYLEEKL